ncbi:CDP-glycerol glycerophosphotransferase family protein [Thomasclavelia cocleata]|uniref:CDP-glycerol glycerophosphotransferase family protein n=1 Tax=Thomasclavelia cocleata TaxID=69824 RepID=UPI00255B272E|nr:CDP-glycerol glycerophosphotransferase family protein [Thomasclavelia cocleata]
MSEDKKSLIDLVPDSVDNAVKNITDKPTQNMGTTLADIWYLVFGGISQAAEKRKLKYSYALQQFENELQEKISKIPKDKRVEPDIQIVAKALEESKYCVEKETFRNMFSTLITSSMNIDFNNKVHPSYIEILKHMSDFDAKLLVMIYQKNTSSFTNLIENNINDLYIISDMLITDYSSVFFDYAILKRPIYFYMYDLESYRDELRGFYLDVYKDLPGQIIEDENLLLEEIKQNNFDYDKLELFNLRFNNHEDGRASKRVLEILLK